MLGGAAALILPPPLNGTGLGQHYAQFVPALLLVLNYAFFVPALLFGLNYAFFPAVLLGLKYSILFVLLFLGLIYAFCSCFVVRAKLCHFSLLCC